VGALLPQFPQPRGGNWRFGVVVLPWVTRVGGRPLVLAFSSSPGLRAPSGPVLGYDHEGLVLF